MRRHRAYNATFSYSHLRPSHPIAFFPSRPRYRHAGHRWYSTRYKILDSEVVTNDYSKARDLLLTTTSGSEFLFQHLIIKHPNLASVSLANIYIPIYSTTKYLYKYDKLINNYLEIHMISKRPYTMKEISYMYISYLDFESHKNTRDIIRATIELTPVPIPVQYWLPGLGTIFTHLTIPPPHKQHVRQ